MGTLELSNFVRYIEVDWLSLADTLAGLCALVLVLVHQVVHRSAYAQNLRLGSLLYVSTNEQLVQQVVGLVEVEYYIQFAHIAEITVKNLHEQVDHLQDYQLVIIIINACDKVERRVSLIYNLLVLPLNEIAHLRWPRQDS
jgi:hypothetical protein